MKREATRDAKPEFKELFARKRTLYNKMMVDTLQPEPFKFDEDHVVNEVPVAIKQRNKHNRSIQMS